MTLPIKTVNGGSIFIRDVANVRDGFAVQQNIVRQDGQRGALLTIEKAGSASTLAIVAGSSGGSSAHRCDTPRTARYATTLGSVDLCESFVQGVVREGLIAACANFHHDSGVPRQLAKHADHRVSIPLSILTSLLILSALGETINIMTLSGLALAVGFWSMMPRSRLRTWSGNSATGKDLHQGILDGHSRLPFRLWSRPSASASCLSRCSS